MTIATLDHKNSLSQAEEYLQLLDEEEEVFVFRTFDDDKNRKDSSLAKIFIGTIEQHHSALVEYNKKGAGVFVNVQKTDGKGGARKNITGIRCIYHELDKIDILHDKKTLITPSFVVKSSEGKEHRYWLCAEMPSIDFSSVMRRCVADYNSDKNAMDVSRVLRVAGFYHMKDPSNPQLVEVTERNGGLEYSKEEILKAFPPLDDVTFRNIMGKRKQIATNAASIDLYAGTNKNTANASNTKGLLTLTGDTISELTSALIALPSDDRDDWISIGHALKELGDIGKGLWINWSAKASNFEHESANKAWDSFNPESTSYKAVFNKAYAVGWKNNAQVERERVKQVIATSEPKEINHGMEVQDWKANISSEIDYMIPFDSVAKDIQEWILSRSMYPQPALAYAAALSVVGVCIGRNIAYGNIKGNMMFMGLAESGEGKDFPFKMSKKILKKVDFGCRIEGKPASGAAFIEAMVENPSMLLHIDEFGKFLDACSGARASIYASEIITYLTESYTSAHDSLTGKRTKGFDALEVTEPNICLFGMATEGQVFNALTSKDVADGSLARYFAVFGDKHLMPRRVPNDAEPPKELLQKLNALIDKYHISYFIASRQLEVSEEYDKVKFELLCMIKDRSNKMGKEGGDKAMFVPFYNRILVRSVQGAMLIDQCQDPAILRWFVDLELKSVDVFVKKFLHLGSDNETERQAKLLQAKIKEAGKRGIPSKLLLQKTRQIPTYARKQLLEEMLETELIQVQRIKIGKSERESTFYFWNK